jgi:GABA(A) receptor-associated protein
MSYKNIPFERRRAESINIMSKYPGRVPIIVQVGRGAKDIPPLDKNKFLAPMNMTMGQFIYTVRRRINLSAEKALFLFCGDTLPTTATQMGELYQYHADPDGFLYMTYTSESTFG